jgi:hypothetical protein
MLEKNISRSLSEAPFRARASCSFSDGAQQGLDAARVQLGQVLEHEHQGADALGGLAVALFQRGDEAGLGLAVEVVEDVGHHLVAVALGGARQVRHEFGAQGLLDLVEDLALHRLHAQHAHDAFQGEVLGQRGQHAGGVLGLDLGQHHRDGLRVFVLQVVGEHGLVHVAQLVPHGPTRGTADLLHQGVDLLGGMKEASSAGSVRRSP